MRITPAHAGKSLFLALFDGISGGSPRTRGEKASRPLAVAVHPGSPPHTRGKVWKSHNQCLRSRITPAHAGKRVPLNPSFAGEKDHPRTRGEKSGCSFLMSCSVGSPPHTRGKAPYGNRSLPLSRITPAHAGKSFSRKAAHTLWEDHPRTRGEKLLFMTLKVLFQGSPPHTRGKAAYRVSQLEKKGITPAHAGKSLTSWAS